MPAELGRVVDVAALDADRGPRARMRISVPRDWGQQTIVVVAPRRLTCAACDGGGCDGCGRSGGHRLPAAFEGASLQVSLPRLVAFTIVRLPDPFGSDGPLRQLLLEIDVGRPSSEVVAVRPAEPNRPRHLTRGRLAALALSVVALATVAFALLR